MPDSTESRPSRFDALSVALAHELRNPLSTVTMTLELLREEIQGGAGTASGAIRRVDAALDALKRLDRTFGEFLRFSHDPVVELHPVDVNQAIEEALAVVSDEMRARRVTPVLQLDRRVRAIPVDARLLRRALVVLLENVVGGLDGGTVTIQTHSRPDTFAIEVIDTGAAKADDRSATIFDAFFTSLSGESGVGLALTRQIVEAHRGRVAFESARGSGNRFSIILPAGST